MSLPSMSELLVILVVILLVFGHKKLPEIGSGLGRAIKNFKKATIEPDEIDITPQASRSEKKVRDDGEA
jgi:sec-independent protein translocase protein TatA